MENKIVIIITAFNATVKNSSITTKTSHAVMDKAKTTDNTNTAIQR